MSLTKIPEDMIDMALPETDEANTFTATQTIKSTDAGATAGPTLELYRDSASPAAADDIGQIAFQGEDSAGNLENYAKIKAIITDPTSTSEDGKLALQTVVAGTLAARVNVGAGLFAEGVTGGDPGAGKANFTEVQQAGIAVQSVWTYAAQTATTSGATVELATAIPDTAKEIEIILVGVSTGTNAQPPLVQLGDSGGYETSGYASITTLIAGANCNEDAHTDGFEAARPTTFVAADTITGVLRLHRWDAAEHLWIAAGQFTNDGGYHCSVVGSKTTSAALDRIRLTTTGGAATFDAGEARVRYR